jgi:hypothetical protein
MIDQDLSDLWVPTGLLLGFQVTLFQWRLERETAVGDKGDITWLVPSDYLGILGMLIFVIGTILLPLAEVISVELATVSFGLGALLFVGQILGLAGHYQLYDRTKPREFVWCPAQEGIVIGITVIIGAAYLAALV